MSGLRQLNEAALERLVAVSRLGMGGRLRLS